MPAIRSTARHLPLLTERPSFAQTLDAHEVGPLVRERVRTLQVNLGRRCNMACHHCHVEAGPKRTEIMSRHVAERIVALVEKSPDIELVDLTGGAPELNPEFRWLVEAAHKLGRRVIDRCNLTVLFEPGLADLPNFLADHEVEVVASLPCYGAENVDAQRGVGAFDKSIEALRRLNARGYGRAGSPLRLSLVYNPSGACLPPDQAKLEAKYRTELARLYAIEFTDLLTITNMPIKRFAHELDRGDQRATYMQLLMDHFNPDTVADLMCRSLVSVSWDGRLHDCDFNQMTELPLGVGPRTIWSIESLAELAATPVATSSHCFGCTAGAGSSCSGALR